MSAISLPVLPDGFSNFRRSGIEVQGTTELEFDIFQTHSRSLHVIQHFSVLGKEISGGQRQLRVDLELLHEQRNEVRFRFVQDFQYDADQFRSFGVREFPSLENIIPPRRRLVVKVSGITAQADFLCDISCEWAIYHRPELALEG